MKQIPERFDGTKSLRLLQSSLGSTEVSGSQGRQVSLRFIWRVFRRNWWQAVLLWGLGSGALMALAFYQVKPNYDAIAVMRIEQGEQGMYARSASSTDFTEYKETQVVLITSPIVLGIALTVHPDLYHLPTLQNTEDVEAEIRQKLAVQIVPNTNLIRVSMSSKSSIDSATIVNAVVDAYLKNATTTNFEYTDRQIKRLKDDQATRLEDVKRKRNEIHRLREKLGVVDTGGLKDRNALTLDQYRRYTDRLTDVEICRMAAQVRLDRLQTEKAFPGQMQTPTQSHIDARVRDAFYAFQEVAELQRRLEHSLEALREAARRSRFPSDPARVRHQNDVNFYKHKRDELWVRLRPRLEQELRSMPVDENAARALREAESQLATAQSEELALDEKLKQMRIENESTGGEQLNLEFAQDDLKRAMTLLNTVEDNLNQLQFEASSPIARIHKEFSARPSSRPSSNRRVNIMGLAPFVVGFGVLVLFVFLELQSERVVDPDELLGRLRLRVIGVVPPLPQLALLQSTTDGNGLVSRAEFRERRRLDEFVQSLDHLRVALIARPYPWGNTRHSVLITSACGGEGKTTLAAQLAERCVNAGLMTLLIDADLRNPTLSRLLDASANSGLINVLRGAVAAEEVIIVINDAGGFHFLPAGTPNVDPSCLLQGEEFGKLMARARESFDMIIVDSPPVLPVPDALMIGRWTDGVVLAVRSDTSKFSLIKRATRCLAHVGIPLIGVVVNGVRSTKSSYGGYSTYGASNYVGGGSALDDAGA